MPYATIEIREHVATLTLDFPDGQLNQAASDAVADAARVLAENRAVHAIVVCTRGADFCTGWSAEVLGAELEGGLAVPTSAAAIEALAEVPQPVIAAVRGQAHSAGLELALACDIRIAAADATFALPEVALGMVPLGGGTQRLPRAVGRAHALRLALLGETIDATEAQRIGLVSAVVPSTELIDAAVRQAQVIASRGPLATRTVKEAIYRGVELPLQQALRYELDLTVILQTTADRAEGVRAFIERRPPRFTGS